MKDKLEKLWLWIDATEFRRTTFAVCCAFFLGAVFGRFA